MTRIRAVLSVVAAVGLVTAFAFTPQGSKVGAKAPSFKAQATDGKTYDLGGLTAKGDLNLYFIKIGCPVNHRAAPHFNKIAQTYGEKGNLVGVINGTLEDAKAWAKQYGAKFPILADPDMKIIRAYGAMHSPWAVSVSSGKIAKVWDDGSPKTLTALNQSAAKQANTKLVALTFDGAPSGGG